MLSWIPVLEAKWCVTTQITAVKESIESLELYKFLIQNYVQALYIHTVLLYIHLFYFQTDKGMSEEEQQKLAQQYEEYQKKLEQQKEE